MNSVNMMRAELAKDCIGLMAHDSTVAEPFREFLSELHLLLTETQEKLTTGVWSIENIDYLCKSLQLRAREVI